MPRRNKGQESSETEEAQYVVLGRIYLSAEERYPHIGEVIPLSADRAESLLAQGLIEKSDNQQVLHSPAEEETTKE